MTTPPPGRTGEGRTERLAAEAAAEFGGAVGDGMGYTDLMADILSPLEQIGNIMPDVTADLEAERQRLREGLMMQPADFAAATAPQQEQVASLAGTIGKALVGTFQSTRGNTLQMVPRMEKLQEEANKLQEDNNELLEDLVGTKQPFVFVA
jgi:hypothetical protein